MKKLKSKFAIATLLFSGVALACATLPMPVPRINVSVWNLLVATFQRQTNPAQSSFLNNLDAAGEAAVGAAAWVENNYVGEVLVTTSLAGATGGTLQFIDKPCGKKAISLLPAPANSGGGGSTGSFSNVNYNAGYFRPIFQSYRIDTVVDGVTTSWYGYEFVGYEWVPGGPGSGNRFNREQ